MYFEEDYRDAVFGADTWCHGSELFSECPTPFLSSSLLFDGFKLINYFRNAICTSCQKMLQFCRVSLCTVKPLIVNTPD